ncbi:MAG: hypothetical protein ACE5IY_10155 [bacterium]
MRNISGLRHGSEGIGDCFETINDAKRRVMPLLVLMSSMAELNPTLGAVFTNEDLGDIGMFLRDEFGEVFKAVERIDAICRRNFIK